MLITLLGAAHAAHAAGRREEALAQFEAALQKVTAGGTAGDVADILRRVGVIHHERGEFELAGDAFGASLEIAELNDLSERIAPALIGQAAVEQVCGRLDVAEALYRRALDLSETLDEQRTAATAEQNLGTLANLRGNAPAALEGYRAATERSMRAGDEIAAARVLNHMAVVHADLRQWTTAERCLAEAQSIAERNGDMVLVGMVELNLAELHLRRRQYPEAHASCDRALTLFQPLRMKSHVGEVYKLRGTLHRDLGELEQAGLHLALALGLAEASGNRLLQAETLIEWALVHRLEHRFREAVQRLNRAYELLRELQASHEVLDAERRLRRLRDIYVPTVQRWRVEQAHEVPSDSDDPERLQELVTALGRAVTIEGWDATWLALGAAVADVGWGTVPEEIWMKPGALSADERALMESHAVVGDALLREMGFPEEVRRLARHHHERWDGTGYPDRLAGSDIPLGARVLAVADVYAALTRARSWRSAYSPADAQAILRRQAGTQLDPHLVPLFIDMVRDEADGTRVDALTKTEREKE